MKQELYAILLESKDTVIKVAIVALTVLLAFIAIKFLKRFVRQTAQRHEMPPARSHVIVRFGQTLIYLAALVVVSTVLGFGVEGIFFATSSFFAIVGIAFFANWSILSNATASVILYFAFPFRIGDRLLIENEPRFSGTVPANIAIQKIVTIQTAADARQQKLALAAKSDPA